MISEPVDPKVRDESFEKPLYGHLADAAVVVWKMQNAATEQKEIENLAEIISYAVKLSEMAAVILGHVTRWGMWEAEHEGDGPPEHEGDGPPEHEEAD